MKKFLIISFIGLALGFGGRALWNVVAPTQLGSRLITKTLESATGGNTALASLMESMLGFSRPKTYVILFLNNTELRPGGGFIGAYALGQISQGHLNLIKEEGTEIFDGASDPAQLFNPPGPLAEKLKVKKWFFRDSNWSPDYALSAAQSLDFYKRENGYLSNQIDGVLAFTPTVIEKFLQINGPITVDDITFTAENVTEKLQYEVEYGFAEKGIARPDRKGLLKDFSIAVIKMAKQKGLWNVSAYLRLGEEMLKQKQIMLYSTNAAEQASIETLGYGGRTTQTPGDYLLWVDANLGALKTDWAIQRTLHYELKQASEGVTGVATMNYRHTAARDWRTSRYISYTRVYVPLGSQLVSAYFKNRGAAVAVPVDQGIEFGRKWFGAYITIEPQSSGDLSFTYTVAPEVLDSIKNRAYSLAIDKELGTNNTALTLGLDFGRTIRAASPGEVLEKHGDSRYDVITDLSVNRVFTVSLNE